MHPTMISPAAALLCTLASASQAQELQTEPIAFEVEDLTLSGQLSLPASGDARALVILVHGYGRTNVIQDNWYYDLRTQLASRGIASFTWDKPGCGESDGEFDADQSVQSSAREVVAAAAALREFGVPGSERIGLWGVSRAGWIAPLALDQDPKLAFWISVSGVDDKESFGYLLRSNWRIEGYSEERASELYGQWQRGNEIVAQGGSHASYLEATALLRKDPFYAFVTGRTDPVTETEYAALVKKVAALEQPIDEATGLAIYVEDFPALLSRIRVPVLAIFGGKDSIVDWRATRRLYDSTLGSKREKSLRIATFPNGNHNLHRCETGGYREMLGILDAPRMVDGYFRAILEWLDDQVLATEKK